MQNRRKKLFFIPNPSACVLWEGELARPCGCAGSSTARGTRAAEPDRRCAPARHGHRRRALHYPLDLFEVGLRLPPPHRFLFRDLAAPIAWPHPPLWMLSCYCFGDGYRFTAGCGEFVIFPFHFRLQERKVELRNGAMEAGPQ